nr:sarcosine oxidase subunit gamma family protein [Alsobacter ponti]
MARHGRHGRAEGPAGVVVEELRGLALATVIARKGRAADLAAACRASFGVEPASTPRRTAKDGLAVVWSGPGQWLAVAEKGHPLTAGGADGLADALRGALAGLASVTDQSDARGALRLSGPRVRDALAKGLALDLHPRAFRPGDAASTWCALIDVQLWQVDAAPTYDLLVARGFAGSFWHWLEASAAEFGLEVR